MIGVGLSKYLNEERLRGALVLIIALSWFIFPLLLNLLQPLIFNTVFAVCAIAVIAGVAIALPRNRLALQPLHKMMLVLWAGYLLMLLLATIRSGSTFSLVHWGIIFGKFLFFLFLLFYINEKFVVTALRTYANLMALTVLLAVAAIFLAALGVHPLTVVDIQGTLTNFYFGSYYTPHYSPICAPLPIYRIQGLSEEPGAYAFELLPAFFWFLIAEKSYARSAVVAVGLCLTMSFGAALFLLLMSILLLRNYANFRTALASFVGVACTVGLLYAISGSCQTRYLERLTMVSQHATEDTHRKDDKASLSAPRKDDEASLSGLSKDDKASLSALEQCAKYRSKADCIDWEKYYISSTPTGKFHSLKDRFDGMFIALRYLGDHLMGTGKGLGMRTVNSIAAAANTSAAAVGYVVPVLEAGVIGGFFYLSLFAMMGLFAAKTLVSANIDSFDERVKVVVALSVCAVLVMGMQRIQPDVTLWHMWIYAMFFYLLQKPRASGLQRHHAASQ